MDRRLFLRQLVGGVAAAAAVRTWPFRVYSFPTEIVRPTFAHITEVAYWPKDDALDALANAIYTPSPLFEYLRIGRTTAFVSSADRSLLTS